jgi:hypothetical protein
MADRHESDSRESPESPQTGRSGDVYPVTSGATSTERDDTHVSAENEYFSALDLDEMGGEPEDLAQIRSDDALLDALAAQVNGVYSSANGHHPEDQPADLDDEQLNVLLLAWRQDVDSVPLPEMVDIPTALATVNAAKSARRRRPRLLVPVAAAAAVLAIVFAGVGMAARDAQPGDALWGLSKVLYADHARSVEAAQSVRSDLNNAQQALQQGRIDEAKDALQAASSQLPAVHTEDGKDDLQAKHESLLEQLTTTTSNPSVPTNTFPTERSDPPTKPTRPDKPSTPPSSSSEKPSSSSSSSSTPPSSSNPASSSSSGTPDPSAGNGPPRSDDPGGTGSGTPNGVSGNSVSTTG